MIRRSLRMMTLVLFTSVGFLAPATVYAQTAPPKTTFKAAPQGVARKTDSSASVEHLKQSLYETIPPAPWSVSEELVQLAMDRHSEDPLYKPGIRELSIRSSFMNAVEVGQYVEKLRQRSVEISTFELRLSGVPQPIAERIGGQLERPHLTKLREALLKYAQSADSLSPQRFSLTIQTTLQAATLPLLNKPTQQQLDAVTSLLKKSRDSGKQTQRVVVPRFMFAALNESMFEDAAADDTIRLLNLPRPSEIEGMEKA